MSTLNKVWGQPVSALIGFDRIDAHGVGSDAVGPFLECDDGRGYHVVGFQDYLWFAVEHRNIPAKYLSDGWLTSAGIEATQQCVRQILAEKSSLPPAIVETITVEEGSGDDPSIEVAFTLASDAEMTVEKAHTDLMWPFWAAMLNMTDPGTFNWPYLWGQL